MHSARPWHGWQMSLLGGNTVEDHRILASYRLLLSADLNAVISSPPEAEPGQKIPIGTSSFTFTVNQAQNLAHSGNSGLLWIRHKAATPEALVWRCVLIKLLRSSAPFFDIIGLMKMIDRSVIYHRRRWSFVLSSVSVYTNTAVNAGKCLKMQLETKTLQVI